MNYIIDTYISSGSFGNVYKGYDINNKNVYLAIKEVNLLKGGIIELNNLIKISYLINMDNDNTYKYDNICYMLNYYVHNDFIYFIFPFCEYNLTYIIYGFDTINYNSIINILLSISNGLKFLHINNIVHTDIKPCNILLSLQESKYDNNELCITSSDIKICDFGSMLYSDTQYKNTITSTCYRSPETITSIITNEFIIVDEYIDMWSFGCIIYEIMNKTILFNFSEDNLLDMLLTIDAHIYSYKQSDSVIDKIINNLIVYKYNRYNIHTVITELSNIKL